MINRTLFKQTLKANIKLWLVFTLITSALIATFVGVFEPSTISSMTDLMENSAMADLIKDTTFLGMLSSTFFTLHGVLLPLVYIMMTANSLIALQVDRGSMAYVLSTPTKRSTVVLTQAVYLVCALAVMLGIATLVGVASIYVFQSDADVDMSHFLALNFGLFLLMFATSGISFLFSCIFNLSKYSVAFGSGIPIAFFLFALMSTVSDSLEYFKYVSLNTLFDRDAILAGDDYTLAFLILFAVGIVTYGIGVRVFQKKDLPL